jgi:DNA-binding CsgD family transcriptional regulator
MGTRVIGPIVPDPPRRAMVVSTDPLFRDAAAVCLRSEGWLVPACESDGLRALSRLTREPIDAILLIGEMQRISSTALRREVDRRWDDIVVVAVPDIDGGVPREASVDREPDRVLAALTSHGEDGLTLDVADPATPRLASLTPRERTILQRLGRGKTPVEIADELGLSRHTVRSHLANLHRKLDVHRRVELVRLAAVTGLVTDEIVEDGDPSTSLHGERR